MALVWISVPRYIQRTCPVCQGTGYYDVNPPIEESLHGQLVLRTKLLCPFCDGGKLSLYNLRERQPKMLRWMVQVQKLPPDVLVKRVQEGFGQEGLDELHANHFFMNQGS